MQRILAIIVNFHALTRPNEFGSMTARKDDMQPQKAIQDHTKSHKAMLSRMGIHMAMAVKDNSKTI